MTEFLQFSISGLLVGAIYTLIALGIVLIYKSSRAINFAQGEFVMMGGFIFWAILAQLGLPVWAAFLGCIAGAVAVGWLAERFAIGPLIGQPVISLIMVTIGLSAILRGIVLMAWGGPPQGMPQFLPSGGVSFGGVNLSQEMLISFIIAMVLVGILSLFFKYTKAGLAMRASAEDHQAAQSVGISVKSIFSQTWIIAALVGAIAGVLLGSMYGLSTEMSELGLKAFPVVLLGGLESIPGAVIGGLLIGLLEGLAGGYIDPLVGGGIREVAPYIFMIIILLFRPYGLFGLARIERI